MMKISVVENRRCLRLVVEGKLIAPWIAELRRTWDVYRPQLGARTLMIDLRNVTHISQEGEDALLDLMTVGARFTCKGVFIRRVLEQLGRRCKTDRRVTGLSDCSEIKKQR